MKQITTPAIVLKRVNYGEADRIITFLTPSGKLRSLVKGVRRSKSKLAGGIELFSESTVTFIETKGQLARIISTRLNEHWGDIVSELQRMMFGYEAMKLVNSILEDEAEREYYDLLKSTLQQINNLDINYQLVEIWFYVRLLQLQGHGINLRQDTLGQKFSEEQLYSFSFEDMSFSANNKGNIRPDYIKYLKFCETKDASSIKLVKLPEGMIDTLRPVLSRLVKSSH